MYKEANAAACERLPASIPHCNPYETSHNTYLFSLISQAYPPDAANSLQI